MALKVENIINIEGNFIAGVIKNDKLFLHLSDLNQERGLDPWALKKLIKELQELDEILDSNVVMKELTKDEPNYNEEPYTCSI